MMNNNEENNNVVTPVNTSTNTVETSVSKVEPVVVPVNENVQDTTKQVTQNVTPNTEEQVKQVDTTLVVENNVQPQGNIPNNSQSVTPVKPATEVAENQSNNKGPSTFAKIMTTLLFIFLFVFVYFLGDITDYINTKKLEKQTAEITNGKLVCSNEKTTENLDVKISATFTFENKQITDLTYITTSTGDKTKDKEELEKLKEDCNLLKEEIKDYDGISIVCSLNNGINSVKQIFNYATLNVEDVRSAYAEAGGVYPQFKNKDDINSVESKMISSDYKCEKVSN